MKDNRAPELDEQDLALLLTEQAALARELNPRIEELAAVPARRRRQRRNRLEIGLAAAVAVGTVVATAAFLQPHAPADASPQATPPVSAPPPAGTRPTTPPPTAAPRKATLHDFAEAAKQVGLGKHPDMYTNVKLNSCQCSITVFLTDPTRSDTFLNDLRSAFPDFGSWTVGFAPGRLNHADCTSAFFSTQAELHARQLPFQLRVISTPVECSAIQLTVDDVEAARAYLSDPANGFTSWVLPFDVKFGDVRFMDSTQQ